MKIHQKSAIVAAGYIAAILGAAHLGSRNIDQALAVLMVVEATIVVVMLVVALCGLIECLIEEYHEGPRDW